MKGPQILRFLVVAICGAGVYFSQSGLEKFKEQKEIRIAAENDNKKLNVEIKQAESELRSEQDGLRAAKSDFEEKSARLEALLSNEKQLKTELADKNTQLEDQATEMRDQQRLLEEVKGAFKNEGGDVTIDNIGEKIAEIESNKKELTKQHDELTTLIAGAEKAVAVNNASIAELSNRKAKRDEKISQNANEAVIAAVDNNWGFVIIGAGSNAGFTPQTELLVKRDGRLIGKIQPTSIEASQTVADIQRDSLVPGATIQPGDVVMIAVPSKG